MLETSITIGFAIVLLTLSMVCIHYKRVNKKNEKYTTGRFWNWPHFKTIFISKTIRNRILFTLGAIIVFRLGTLITIPNIDTVGLIESLGDNPLVSMMNLLGGGGLETFSIFALGVGPYITAQIIIQMLSMDVVPRLTELSKQGQAGRLKLNKYTRYLTVVLAIIQSISMVYAFSMSYTGLFENGFTFTNVGFIALIFTAGTMWLVWLGDQITKKGIGNGMSVLIATGILARFPSQFTTAYETLVNGNPLDTGDGIYFFLAFIAVFVIIAIFIGLLNTTEYRIPIQSASNSKILNEHNESNYLPLKFNSASVIPVIFASSIMTVPIQIANLFANSSNDILNTLSQWLGLQTWYSLVLYAVLIVFFCFFYTHLQINPEELSKNLAKSGSYIPSVRPGEETEKFVKTKLNKLTTVGAVALVTISILPYALPILYPVFPASMPIGGTGMIIVVGVLIEIYRQLKGLIIQESYIL